MLRVREFIRFHQVFELHGINVQINSAVFSSLDSESSQTALRRILSTCMDLHKWNRHEFGELEFWLQHSNILTRFVAISSGASGLHDRCFSKIGEPFKFNWISTKHQLHKRFIHMVVIDFSIRDFAESYQWACQMFVWKLFVSLRSIFEHLLFLIERFWRASRNASKLTWVFSNCMDNWMKHLNNHSILCTEDY